MGICGYQLIYKKEQAARITEANFSVEKISSLECIKRYYTNWFGACALLLRRKWLEDCSLMFDEQCTYLEDVPFITQAIVYAHKIAMIDAATYIYYQRQGSLIHSPKIEKYRIGLEGFERMTKTLSNDRTPAAEEFRAMGHARYYLATLRKGAALLTYPMFKELCSEVPMNQVKGQLPKLPAKQKYAGYLFFCSKALFYRAMRLISKEK